MAGSISELGKRTIVHLKRLEKLDIEVKVGTKVVAVTPEGVQLENGLIRARTVI